MQNILFYGNCQVGAISDIMKKTLKNYKITIILCWLENIDKNYFLDKIRESDIIITQPINQNYRNTDYLDTGYILKNAKPKTKIIIFPSLYFNFYYFDLTYKILNDNDILRNPSDYHYNIIINNYNENNNMIINNINNIDLKSKEELESFALSSIEELKKRENEIIEYNNIFKCYLINISSYINNNYKTKLLFYSMNHPTKHIFHYIIEKIINILNIADYNDYNVDPLAFSDRGILYKCIEKCVNFDINEYIPRLSKYNLETKEEIINKYIEIYKEIDLKSISL
jgi:hypothetical protein